MLRRCIPLLVLLVLAAHPLRGQDMSSPPVDSLVVEGNSRITTVQIIGTSGLILHQPITYRDIQRAISALFLDRTVRRRPGGTARGRWPPGPGHHRQGAPDPLGVEPPRRPAAARAIGARQGDPRHRPPARPLRPRAQPREHRFRLRGQGLLPGPDDRDRVPAAGRVGAGGLPGAGGHADHDQPDPDRGKRAVQRQGSGQSDVHEAGGLLLVQEGLLRRGQGRVRHAAAAADLLRLEGHDRLPGRAGHGPRRPGDREGRAVADRRGRQGLLRRDHGPHREPTVFRRRDRRILSLWWCRGGAVPGSRWRACRSIVPPGRRPRRGSAIST